LSFHLAGIIPVAGQKLDYGMPWHDALMPIGREYLAVERCVVECAYAGCKTIWIICNDDTQPLIRYRLGEKVQDPVWAHRSYEKNIRDFQRPIQIYYVPISPKDAGKRDCLSWSVLHGANVAHRICSGMSKWVAPEKYYVSWPYGYYDPSILRAHRKDITAHDNLYIEDQNGKNVKDGEYLGFTFDNSTLRALNDQVRVKSTGLWADEERKKKLSVEERFSYRLFSLSDVFGELCFEDYVVRRAEYYKLDSWLDYCNFISQNREVKRPSDLILSYREWNEIGYDE
jgi:hypothetical protein